ncbi:hypothetical protein Ancab_018774 [Ancistrocladus abbreviatus]
MSEFPLTIMNRQTGGKRKRLESDDSSKDLNSNDQAVLQLIRSKRNMGIWKGDLKRELRDINPKVVDASIKSLQLRNMIKEVVNIQNKGRNVLIAAEFEPSVELTGGEWYNNGTLDTGFIESLRRLCLTQIRKMKVATAKEIQGFINDTKVFKVDVSTNQINQILHCLVLDNEILETKSTGSGDFSRIPIRTVCYTSTGRGQVAGPKSRHMAAIPCGACPRINYCTPDGVISPSTCVYYTKWLDF